MQVYDTLRAGAIQSIRVGKSEIVPAQPSTDKPNVNTLQAKRITDAHAAKLRDIASDDSMSPDDKRDATQAENEAYAKAQPTKEFYPDRDADHRDRLNAIATDKSLTPDERNTKIAEENEAFNDAELGLTDENQDPDEQQDIIHITLAGGEKRSILRSDLLFSPIVAGRPVDGFPVYAQKRPVINTGIKPLDETQPSKPVLASDTVHDQGAAQPVPVVGDYLVEDFDPLTDKFVQKIYDAVTFNRYFKASLN